MSWSRRYAEPEPQRVNRWLAHNGVCSRREAETLIAKGLISIDGEAVSDPGRKIAQGQTLVLAETGQALLDATLSVMVHKPVGVVSSQPEAGQVPAVRLLTRAALWDGGAIAASAMVPVPDSRLAPVGRLDMDSRGLLILSEDGVLAKAVIGPQAGMEKEYQVGFAGALSDRKLDLLRHGLWLDGRALRPADVHRIGDQQLRFVLKEGRNRQIRRMCDLVELKVVDLFRTRIGPLELGELAPGRWRPLSVEERQALIQVAR